MLKTYWREGWHWPPAGKHQISGIQKVETLIFVIFDVICVIWNKICHNSSFTRPAGLVIDSSRSGTCFSSCLASSKHVSITKKCLFDMILYFLCRSTPLPFPQIHFQILQYRNNVSSRMVNRYTRGWTMSSFSFIFFELSLMLLHFFVIFGP